MPDFEVRAVRGKGRSAARVVRMSLSGLGEAVSDLVASIVRGLLPPPAPQPIPVRVRARRRPGA